MPSEGNRGERPTVDPAVGASVGPAEFACGDEELLRSGVPGVRAVVLKERFVSFGVGVSAGSAFLRRAAAEGIPTIARRTGGTGLLHEPGDLAWAVVLPRGDPRLGADFTRAYAPLGRGVVRWLGAHRVEGSWTAASGEAPEYCTLGDRGSVLSASSRILGGAAQHATHRAVLHHGTISRTVDRRSIDRLFGLPRGGPTGKLVGLSDLGVTDAATALAQEVAEAIASDLGSA